MNAKILIVIGAVAAIADEPGRWGVISDQALPMGTLDDQRTELRYLVHVEWHGSANIYGDATITLDATGQTPTPQPYNLTLFATNFADPTVTRATTAPIEVGTTTTSMPAELNAWLDCPSDPCSEDYELRVARPNVPGMVVDFAGAFHLHTEGTGAQPKNASATITVTGPMP